jgi:hypothetical protein
MGFRYLFFITKLNDIFLRIVLQDKYNIGVLTVNIKFTWFRMKRIKLVFFPVSKPRHINSIFTVNTPIFYMQVYTNPTPRSRITTLSYNFCHMSKIGSSNIPRDNKCMSLCRHLILSIAYSFLLNGTAIIRYLAFRTQINMNFAPKKKNYYFSAVYTF